MLFLGTLGAFSLRVCESALDAGADVAAVVVHADAQAGRLLPRASKTGDLPILTPYRERSLAQLAWEREIPAFSSPDAGDLARLAGFSPDVVAVACWPRLISRSTRDLARLAVNVHPSLLPDNRGPAPLFWTFRLGQRRTGVTVHLLGDRADMGAILAQRDVPVPDGVAGADLEANLARLGGELLARVTQDFVQGSLDPKKQDESRASYHPWPAPDDWLIPAEWTAQRRWNFERGVSHLARPVQAR